MERKYRKMEDSKTIAEMNAEADDKLIAWSLKMVREGRVDFGKYSDDMAAYLDSWFRIPFVDQFMTETYGGVFDCGLFNASETYHQRPVVAHVGSLLGFDRDESRWSQLDYADILLDAFSCYSQGRKADRCDMVVYGLLLYTLRSVDWDTYQDEYSAFICESWRVDTSSDFAKTMKVFLTALIRGWDFPDDGYPIEFLVELADTVA